MLSWVLGNLIMAAYCGTRSDLHTYNMPCLCLPYEALAALLPYYKSLLTRYL